MAEANVNSRLEAFCDGVFAIALTLLIIDVKLTSPESITTTDGFWHALKEILPSVVAFALSFAIILITWVNHHAALRLVNKSSAAFNYANGFLLLSVVAMPFPTSLLGEFILTDHAAPAVVLYEGVSALTAIGWILMGRVALRDGLLTGERARATARENTRNSYFALALYSAFAIIAFWLPLTIALVSTATWIFWLVYGIRMKHEA